MKGDSTDGAYLRIINDGSTSNHGLEIGGITDGTGLVPVTLQLGRFGGGIKTAAFSHPLTMTGESESIVTIVPGSPPVLTYTTTIFDYTVLVNSPSPFTVNLLATNITVGRIFRVKNIGTGTVTVQSTSAGSPPVTPNIDNAGSFSIPTQYADAEFQWDGSSWWVF
jgi:hypothetical protein